MRRLCARYMWLFAVVMLLTSLGCTLAEWSKIKDDAVVAAPEAINDILTNPSPVGIAIVITTFISGLFAKSAARGFGKGAVLSAKGVSAGAVGIAQLASFLFSKVISFFSKPKSPEKINE
jgi:hypothetical protein